MPSKVESERFFDLGASLALRDLAEKLHIKVLDSSSFKHTNKSALSAVIGVDTNYNPTIFPRDIKAHFCFTTRPYSCLRPKGWDNQSLARFYKLVHMDYGALMHSLSHGDGVFDFLELRYYDFVFIATNYHKNLIESKQATFYQQTYTKIFSVGSGKFEEIVSAFSDYSPPQTIRTIAYMPRWCDGEGLQDYCSFMRIFPYLLDLAKCGHIELIFRPHPNMYDHFVNATKILTKQQWEAMTQELDSLPNATLDTNPSLLETFCKADVLISDASSMLVYGFLSGKPTIYTQNQIGGEVNNWALQWLQGCFIANDTHDLHKILLSLQNDCKSTMRPKILIREEIIEKCFTFLQPSSTEAIKQILLADIHSYTNTTKG